MREKLVKAYKCLHVIRTLWGRGVLSGGAGLSVSGYVPSSSDLNSVQHFLDSCYKRRYISRKLNIRELLERSDCRIFRKALSTNSTLVTILPERNFTNYALRKPCFYYPIVATERFKSS